MNSKDEPPPDDDMSSPPPDNVSVSIYYADKYDIYVNLILLLSHLHSNFRLFSRNLLMTRVFLRLTTRVWDSQARQLNSLLLLANRLELYLWCDLELMWDQILMSYLLCRKDYRARDKEAC